MTENKNENPIRRRRKKLAITQKQAAESLGWAQYQISNIESGKADPTLSRIISLAALLGVKPGTLVDELADWQADSEAES